MNIKFKSQLDVTKSIFDHIDTQPKAAPQPKTESKESKLKIQVASAKRELESHNLVLIPIYPASIITGLIVFSVANLCGVSPWQ